MKLNLLFEKLLFSKQHVISAVWLVSAGSKVTDLLVQHVPHDAG